MSFKCKLGGFSGVLEREDDYIYIVGTKKFLRVTFRMGYFFLISKCTPLLFTKINKCDRNVNKLKTFFHTERKVHAIFQPSGLIVGSPPYK